MRFNLDTIPPPGMALYVSRVAVTGQFWLNGSVLNPEVRFTQPRGLIGTYTGGRASLITLPQGLFRLGENVLHIRVQSFAVGGDGLWDVRVGPVEELRTPWLLRRIPQQMIPQGLFALMAASSIFALLVWWRERRTRNLHFAAVMVLWTVIVGLWLFPPPPVSRNALIVLMVVLHTVFYWALLDIFYRYSESDWHWYPRVLSTTSILTLLLALGIVLVASSAQHLSELIGWAMLPTVLLRLLATVMLVQTAWRRRSRGAFLLAATEVLWFSGHLQLMSILAGWLSPDPFRLDPSVSLPLYLALQYLFIERLVRDREQAAREQQAAISAERARILQDMHDGMGSQLITALRLAKRKDGDSSIVVQNIEEALQDLRLIIDSLDASDQSLEQMLGDLRYRIEPRLTALGIRLDWDVQPPPELAGLGREIALGVLRIVQEALNNAVRHAQPTVITVSLTRRDGSARIGVADDGTGFDPSATPISGRGLSGMRKRAEQLGATFHIERREGGGTQISLLLPLASSISATPGWNTR